MILTPENFRSSLHLLLKNFNEKRFLLAVSGGADSMVLAYLFKVSNLKFHVAHINYKLRGEHSEKDKELVQDFCKKHEIPFHLYEVSEKDNKPEGSIQLWARNLRYDFFRKIQKQENLEFLVTAHHLNDQLETFLINLSRGSGLKGLCAIPENENGILRPLLHIPKEEIYRFAEENNIDFREDLSNHKNDYLRNKFRNEVVPKMNEAAPDFLNGFEEALNHLKSANMFIQSKIEKAFTSILIASNETEIILDRKKFLNLDMFLIHEIILKFGFRGEEINKIISAENGKMFRSKTHELYISRNEIKCFTKTFGKA